MGVLRSPHKKASFRFRAQIELIVTPAGRPGVETCQATELTVNPVNAVDVPDVAFTVTVRTLSVALAAIVIVIGRLVAVPPPRMTAVTPVPLNVTAVAPVRFVPVMVADAVVPRAPIKGVIANTAGGKTATSSFRIVELAESET